MNRRIKVFPAGVFIEPVMFGNRFNGLQEIRGFTLAPGGNRAVGDFQGDIGHDKAVVKEQLHPQPVADRTGPERRVERKQARFNLGDGKAADRTGEFFAENNPLGLALVRGGFQHANAVGQIQRRAKTVGKPLFQPFLDHNPVHHHVNVMAQFLVQNRHILDLVKRAVDLDALKALFAQVDEILAVFALAVTYRRGQQIAARALGQGHHPVNHVLHLLRHDRQAGRGAERGAGAGEQQAQVIVNLGHGANGGTGIFRRGFLLDGNRRRQAGNMVHIRLFHHVEELPGIGRQ